MKSIKRIFVAAVVFVLSVLGGDGVWAACGINIDPANPLGFPTPQSIQGTSWVRIEFKDCTASNDPADPTYKLDASIATYQGIIDGYRSAGISTVLIIDYMSYPSATEDPEGFGIRAGLIAQGLGSNGIVYQIWNEPDIWQGGNLSPQEYSTLLNNAATQIKANSGAQVITAGFASGQASYLNGVDLSNVDAIAFHPYGKVPNGSSIGNTGPLGASIDEYHSAGGGKSIWITEIGLNSTDQAIQAQYLREFYNHVNGDSRIAHTLWFAWSDGMVTPFGIVTSGNIKKQSHSAFFSTGCGRSAPGPVENLPAITMQEDPGVSCSPGGGSHGREKVERTIIGRVISSKTFTNVDTGATKTQVPVQNARICVYQGAQTGSDGIGSTIINFETSDVTNEDGYFAVDSWLRYRNPDGLDTGASYFSNGAVSNYIGVLCGNEIHEVFQMDMNSLQRTALSQKYWMGMRDTIVDKITTKPGVEDPTYPIDFLWSLNTEILTPIEMTLKCDPNPPTPGFSSDPDEAPWRQQAVHFETGEVVSACPLELIYTDRSGETEGGCDGGKLLPQPQTTAEHTGTFTLRQVGDDSERGSGILALIERLFSGLGGRKKPQHEYEGTVTTSAVYRNTMAKYANPTQLMYGGMGQTLKAGIDWPTKDFPDPDVVSCEYWKQGNKAVNTGADATAPLLNLQNANGFVTLLRPPVDSNNPQGSENLYLQMDKTTPICFLEDGTLITLGQIKPPTTWESYYRRMDAEDRAEFCQTYGIPPDRCLEEVPVYTSCVPGAEGCRYLLGTEYFPYSIVAKNKGGMAGNEYYIEGTAQGGNQAYTPAIEGDRRKQFFIHDQTLTYDLEDGKNARAAMEPADKGHGWDGSGASFITETLGPGAYTETAPEGGWGKPGLMSLSPVTGLESGVLQTKESAHRSIKGFDHCIISVLDGHRVWPITRAALSTHPETYQAGWSATNFKVATCLPIKGEDGNPSSVCDETVPIRFYEEENLRDKLGSLVSAVLYNIFSIFTKPEGTCTTRTTESCAEGSTGCTCEVDCGPTADCYNDCMESCTAGDECNHICTEECCTKTCERLGEEKYACDGQVDPASFHLEAKTHQLDASQAFRTANGIAAMILPPGLLEKGEFATRQDLCVVDQYVGSDPYFSSENSVGIERPCDEYTDVMEAARQAVTIPGSNKL